MTEKQPEEENSACQGDVSYAHGQAHSRTIIFIMITGSAEDKKKKNYKFVLRGLRPPRNE